MPSWIKIQGRRGVFELAGKNAARVIIKDGAEFLSFPRKWMKMIDWKTEVEFLRMAPEINDSNVDKNLLQAAKDDGGEWAGAWLDELFSHRKDDSYDND